MGFFSDLHSSAKGGVDTGFLGLPSVSGFASGFSGETGAKAAEAGAAAQAQSAREALEFQEKALKLSRSDLAPFRNLGISALGDFQSGVSDIQAPNLGFQGELISQGLLGSQDASQNLQNQAAFGGLIGAAGATGLKSGVSDISGQLDPDILNSPFFQAQQDEALRSIEARAAAGGKRFSGGAERALAKERLLGGQQFAQQDLQNRLGAQSQMFDQLRGAAGFGQSAQAQGFGQTQAAGAFGQGAQQQALNQLTGIQQRGFGNQLTANQQRFGQLGDLAQLGQASAARQAAGNLQSAQASTDLLTGIGNAQAAGGIGAAQAQGQGSQNVVQGLGMLASIFSDRRLKENIKLIGKTPGGHNWYSYDYIWGESSEGVMADEVGHIDGAVTQHDSGFDMVNYARIL